MPFTQLRRRRADAYRVRMPPAETSALLDAAHQVAWDDLGGRVVYHRWRGTWQHAPGEPNEVLHNGSRRDQVASVPLASLPFADPMLGALYAQYYETPKGDQWHPRWNFEGPMTQVEALAVDPITGRLAVYWHVGYSHNDYPDSVLHVSAFSAQGVLQGTSSIQLGQTFEAWAGVIGCAFGQGGLWALEPMPVGTPIGDDGLPMRVTFRTGSFLGLSNWRDLDATGGDSICPDPEADRAWAFLVRRFASGTGPFPVYSALGSYDATYVLPLDAGLGGDEELLHFDLPGDAVTPPWTIDELFPWGRAVVLDQGGATPEFVSIGYDPAGWPDGSVTDQIWRFTLPGGGTRLTGAGRQNPASGFGEYGRSLWRTAPGEYLVHRGEDSSVDAIFVEPLP